MARHSAYARATATKHHHHRRRRRQHRQFHLYIYFARALSRSLLPHSVSLSRKKIQLICSHSVCEGVCVFRAWNTVPHTLLHTCCYLNCLILSIPFFLCRCRCRSFVFCLVSKANKIWHNKKRRTHTVRYCPHWALSRRNEYILALFNTRDSFEMIARMNENIRKGGKGNDCDKSKREREGNVDDDTRTHSCTHETHFGRCKSFAHRKTNTYAVLRPSAI